MFCISCVFALRLVHGLHRAFCIGTIQDALDQHAALAEQREEAYLVVPFALVFQ